MTSRPWVLQLPPSFTCVYVHECILHVINRIAIDQCFAFRVIHKLSLLFLPCKNHHGNQEVPSQQPDRFQGQVLTETRKGLGFDVLVIQRKDILKNTAVTNNVILNAQVMLTGNFERQLL